MAEKFEWVLFERVLSFENTVKILTFPYTFGTSPKLNKNTCQTQLCKFLETLMSILSFLAFKMTISSFAQKVDFVNFLLQNPQFRAQNFSKFWGFEFEFFRVFPDSFQASSSFWCNFDLPNKQSSSTPDHIPTNYSLFFGMSPSRLLVLQKKLLFIMSQLHSSSGIFTKIVELVQNVLEKISRQISAKISNTHGFFGVSI